MRTEPTPRARRYGAAIFFVVLGTLLGAWHNRTTDRGKPDYVAGAVRGAVAPPAGALGGISRWIGDKTGWLFRGRASAEETTELRARIAELEGQTAELREAQIKYDQLRTDLGFAGRDNHPKIAADIIARRPDPKFETCMLNRGSLAGITRKSVVVTRGGVVGQVSEVTPTTATVLLLTDQNSGVGARFQRSRAEGICKGQNRSELSIINIPSEADVKPGDVVMTSGMGKVYPAGLALGKVISIKTEEGNLMKTAQVRSNVDFDHLEQVYVLP